MATKPFINTGNLGYGITKHGCTCPCGVVAYFREGKRYENLGMLLNTVAKEIEASLGQFAYQQCKQARTLRANMGEVNQMIAEEMANA